jgi:spermidine synthase
MIPWTLIDAATVPGGGELRLKRRGTEFVIMLGDNQLMSNRLSVTEQALATIGCDTIRARKQARILIGGLGMGFTLRAALAVLGPDAHVDVAELAPAVVAWARGPLSDMFGGCLTDSRVAIHETDVGILIRKDRAAYDAILLDVDNGPQGLSRRANDTLYSAEGLRAAHAALRPGGVLAVWSSGPDAKFTARLRKAGFAVKEIPLRAVGPHGGARHFIWTATRVQPSPNRRKVPI